MKKTALLLVIALISFSYTYGQGWGEWQHSSYITQGEKKIMEVKSKTYYSKNYYPQIKWQVTNLTGNTYYDFGIGDKEYTFANGVKKTSSAEGMDTMDAYETESFISDTHCCDGDRVTNVKLNYVQFRIEKSGERYKVDL
jgi:hypothetical protein